VRLFTGQRKKGTRTKQETGEDVYRSRKKTVTAVHQLTVGGGGGQKQKLLAKKGSGPEAKEMPAHRRKKGRSEPHKGGNKNN